MSCFWILKGKENMRAGIICFVLRVLQKVTENYIMKQLRKKQERCEPFQDDRELLWVWMRTGLVENGFG